MRFVAVDDNRAYSEAWMLFKDCTTFLPNDVSMLLMISQQCMADAFLSPHWLPALFLS